MSDLFAVCAPCCLVLVCIGVPIVASDDGRRRDKSLMVRRWRSNVMMNNHRLCSFTVMLDYILCCRLKNSRLLNPGCLSCYHCMNWLDRGMVNYSSGCCDMFLGDCSGLDESDQDGEQKKDILFHL